MSHSLADKVIIVTGASSGIGRAAARRFAEEGARLVLVARSEEKLRALAEEIGGDAIVVPADLAVPDSASGVAAEAERRLGRVDVLFANAGIYIPGDIAGQDPDEWDRMIGVNVNGLFRTVRAVLPGMIARRSGDIVVTSSISGHQALHWEPIYSATKHAVQSFVHGVRRQMAPHNIRVGEVSPGIVLNELWGYTDPAAIDARVAAHAGLRSEDIAEAVLFMLTRPPHVTIRDLVVLPQNQDI